eukprot:CAMPEP_0173295206 /NCGR_PEP_ID=MMETSP1143-20121109/14311_1 /TAXON_ID=483371 /ORGANISM="non described non described, Strain CCMP2298" /LENGTH=227 /DNA_ID=CAMNT_0014234991 /DNA_START=92 /DNA_END=772 /DNA_ORIENTATION=+
MSDIEEDTPEMELSRQKLRQDMRSVAADVVRDKHQMGNIHSNAYATVFEKYSSIIGATAVRELQVEAAIHKDLANIVRQQAAALCDMSGRFNWDLLAASLQDHFPSSASAGGLNWGLFGSQARRVYTCVPGYSTMIGPMVREERVRKVSVRTVREKGVAETQGEILVNDDKEENEATNIRLKKLTEHLLSRKGDGNGNGEHGNWEHGNGNGNGHSANGENGNGNGDG